MTADTPPTAAPVRHATPQEVEALDRAANAAGVIVHAFALVQKYGRGGKAGRADYLVSMRADELTPLTDAVDALLRGPAPTVTTGRTEDEAIREIAAFDASDVCGVPASEAGSGATLWHPDWDAQIAHARELFDNASTLPLRTLESQLHRAMAGLFVMLDVLRPDEPKSSAPSGGGTADARATAARCARVVTSDDRARLPIAPQLVL